MCASLSVASNFSANNELALHVADPAAAEEFYTHTLGCVRDPYGVIFDLIERVPGD
jgi:hypothetical protein